MKKLIKFYADWCGPCKLYAKTWDEVTKKYEGQVELLNVNVEEDLELTTKYRVRNIPFTVLIKEDGSEITKAGKLSAQELEELILS